ncbi:MAG: ATP-binding cassette domain-containing protein [Bacteroidales bacterium]|jgi:phospholipid/cholesterol/gamma-HCH transport system ATP-binding protein|nr:ATP-binding cassette domain-containing protein [Bacteroidales bacterium]
MIRIENIVKTFSGVKILHEVSAEFYAGKTNLIIGQSGSGKTVLLKCIVGLHHPDQGNVFYGDRNYSQANFNVKKEIRKEIGMVFQGSALFTSETIQDNVMFPLNMFGKQTKKEKQIRVDQCLERVGIDGTNLFFPGELSGGMQKRAAIARAIVLNPKYLFCDEPNSGLDPITSLKIDELISDITKEYNITSIINTHDMNSLMQIGENILFLNDGVKAWEGTNKEMFNSDSEVFNSFVFASEIAKILKQKQ